MFNKKPVCFLGTILIFVFFLSIALVSTVHADYQTDLVFNGYIQDNAGDINVGNYSVPVVYDWNSDGKKDLLVGQNNGGHGYITYFENQGANSSPTFGSGTYLEASCTPCTTLDVAAGG